MRDRVARAVRPRTRRRGRRGCSRAARPPAAITSPDLEPGVGRRALRQRRRSTVRAGVGSSGVLGARRRATRGSTLPARRRAGRATSRTVAIGTARPVVLAAGRAGEDPDEVAVRVERARRRTSPVRRGARRRAARRRRAGRRRPARRAGRRRRSRCTARFPSVDADRDDGLADLGGVVGRAARAEVAVGTREQRQVGLGSVPTTLPACSLPKLVDDDDVVAPPRTCGAREHPVAAHHDPGADRGAGRRWWRGCVTTLGIDELAHPVRDRVVDGVARAGDDRRRERRAVAPAERAERHQHEDACAEHRRDRGRADADRPVARAGSRGGAVGVLTNERSSLGCTQGRSRGSGGGPLGRVLVLRRAVVTLRIPTTWRGVYRRPSTASRRPDQRTPGARRSPQVGAWSPHGAGTRRSLRWRRASARIRRLDRRRRRRRCRSTPPPRGRRPRVRGAVVIFLGVVRDHSDGRDGVARPHLRGLRGARRCRVLARGRRSGAGASGRSIDRVALLHRTGDLALVGAVGRGRGVVAAPRRGVRGGALLHRHPEGDGPDLEARALGGRLRLGHRSASPRAIRSPPRRSVE